MATVQTPSEQRFVLNHVPWRTYERLLRIFASRPGVRLTYDRGILEFMTLSHEHESRVHLLRRLIEALTEELNLPVKGGRSTTLRQRPRRRGLEPDECYWIASEPMVRNKDRLDLQVDPPPDLALEIDVSHSSVNRLGIYAALSVPEVWRYDGLELTFLILQADGHYAAAERSLSFSQVSPADLLRFLAVQGQTDENTILRQFRAWVRNTYGQ